jgi:hypothetical protein
MSYSAQVAAISVAVPPPTAARPCQASGEFRHGWSDLIAAMEATTIWVDIRARDRLARIANEEFHGASLSEVLALLIAEHEMRHTHAA